MKSIQSQMLYDSSETIPLSTPLKQAPTPATEELLNLGSFKENSSGVEMGEKSQTPITHHHVFSNMKRQSSPFLMPPITPKKDVRVERYLHTHTYIYINI